LPMTTASARQPVTVTRRQLDTASATQARAHRQGGLKILFSSCHEAGFVHYI
jgi:hypothetical protein